MTLIAILPEAARAQAETPGALDLATLPTIPTGNTFDKLLIGYDNGWVYQLVGDGESNTITSGIPFNGTLTGTMASDKARQVRLISSGSDKTLTLKDVTVEPTASLYSQTWQVLGGVELTLLVSGTRPSVINMKPGNGEIINQGTLTLTTQDQPLDIRQGSIANNGILIINATKRLSVKNASEGNCIQQFTGANITLNGEIYATGGESGIATSMGSITVGEGARISAQGKNAFLFLGAPYDQQTIQLFYAEPPAAGQTLTIIPADGSTPYSFTTDGTSKSFGIIAKEGVAYSATLDGKRQYSTTEGENGGVSRNRAFFLRNVNTSYSGAQYHRLTGTRPTSQPLDLSVGYKREAPTLRYDTESEWTLDGELFDGTLMNYPGIDMNLTIHAEGNPTLNLRQAVIYAPEGKTALTVASGEVTLEVTDLYASSSKLLGTYGLRVETGAKCHITPSTASNEILTLSGKQAAIDPDGGGTVDGLTQLTWETELTENINLYSGDTFIQQIFSGMNSIALNLAAPFRAKSTQNHLWQEGYLSTDAGKTYTDEFAAATATGVTHYLDLRAIPEPPIIINTAVTFDAALHENKPIIVTKDGILTVNTFSVITTLTLEEGGQVQTDLAEDTPLYFRLNQLILAYPNRNQWKAISCVGQYLSVTSRKGSTAIYGLSGYTAADKQAWQGLTIPEANSPLLLAGDGIAGDTLEIYSQPAGGGQVCLNTPIPESPAAALNNGVFLFRANLRLHDTEMENIYVLSDDGSRFELRDKVTLRPAESYVVANAATRNILKSLRLDGVVTGTDTPAVSTNDSLRAWTANGSLHLSANHSGEIYIYHVSGTLKAYLPSLRGETSVALPSGIYIVRQGETSIKVSL